MFILQNGKNIQNYAPWFYEEPCSVEKHVQEDKKNKRWTELNGSETTWVLRMSGPERALDSAQWGSEYLTSCLWLLWSALTCSNPVDPRFQALFFRLDNKVFKIDFFLLFCSNFNTFLVVKYGRFRWFLYSGRCFHKGVTSHEVSKTHLAGLAHLR